MTRPLRIRRRSAPAGRPASGLAYLWDRFATNTPSATTPVAVAAAPANVNAMPWEERIAPDALTVLRRSDAADIAGGSEARNIDICRGQPPVDVRIAAALQHMEENPDLPLTVAELAEVAGLPICGFRTRFHRETGRTPHDHLMHLRVSQAKTALVETDLDMVCVALLCGFGSRDDLSASFEAQVGTSPDDWRAARR